MNRTAERMFGIGFEEALGRMGTEWMHPDYRELVKEKMLADYEGVYEALAQRKDGSTFPCDIQARMVEEDGKAVRVTALRDITERKRAEEALRASEAELQALFAGMTDAVLVLDREGRYLKIAPTPQHLYYKPSVELLGKTLHEVFPKEQADAFLNSIHQSLDSRQTISLEYSLDIGEKTIWFDGQVSPMSGDTSIFVARDITERKELEQLREDVERLMRHDLKSPLNGVIGLPQIMMDDENLTPEQVEHLKLIQEAGYRMLNQINLSLDLYKMETGAFEYEPGLTESVGLLKRLLHDLGLKAGNKGVKVETLVKGVSSDKAESILFQADEALCHTMLSNILDNAVEASHMGERVSLRLEEEPDAMVFSVHNAGIVAEAVRDIFFDKYATHGKKQGTGLGTYSAKLTAEAMGGSIGFTSSDAEGTTVTIRLPRG